MTVGGRGFEQHRRRYLNIVSWISNRSGNRRSVEAIRDFMLIRAKMSDALKPGILSSIVEACAKVILFPDFARHSHSRRCPQIVVTHLAASCQPQHSHPSLFVSPVPPHQLKRSVKHIQSTTLALQYLARYRNQWRRQFELFPTNFGLPYTMELTAI